MSVASQVTASAPGKLILMGEHAAVYGRPALVVALGLRTRVLLARRGDAGVRIALGDLGVDEGLDWSQIVGYGDAARRAWTADAQDSSVRQLERMRARDSAHVVKTALAETVRTLRCEAPGIDVEVSSELPVGAGFGSSASVAVATSGALLTLLTGEGRPDLVERIALEVERRQHGRPSGVDHATVLRGGVQWAERSDDGGLRCETLHLAPGALDRLAVFHTGTPAESTGEMVESVRQRFDDRPEELEVVLSRMEAGVVELRERLTERFESNALVALLRNFERDLEALGVVPESVRRTVRRVEESGGAAKVSGAGGLRGPEAGSLLAYHPHESVSELPCLGAYRRFDVELGVHGLELEPVEAVG